MVDLYPDGSCLGNPGPGAWAFILTRNGEKYGLSGFEAATTNNRMELIAAIEALKYVHPGESVRLFSDSRYLIDGVTRNLEKWKLNGWKTSKRKPVKNVDLWQEIDRLNQLIRPQWIWLRGSDGNEFHEEAHQLAHGRLQQSYTGETTNPET